MNDDIVGNNTDTERPFATPAIYEVYINKQEEVSRKLVLRFTAGRNDNAFLPRSLPRQALAGPRSTPEEPRGIGPAQTQALDHIVSKERPSLIRLSKPLVKRLIIYGLLLLC